MLTVLAYQDGRTWKTSAVDPTWLQAGSTVVFWADFERPDEAEGRLLRDAFHFHELAIEDALDEVHHPKIEQYEGFLYLILHGILTGQDKRGFVTQDVDFFLGPNFLVTVHGQPSRSIAQQQDVCLRHTSVLAQGPPGLMHRIVDALVDHYWPEVDLLEDRLEELERVVFEKPLENPLRRILALKQEIASFRRIVLPERDAIGRLARREFAAIPDELAYRFRDVHDDLINLADHAVAFQDQATSLLDAYLSAQSNRMNQVMKLLTVIATIFMPLTVLTGMWGMNVGLPHLPGGDPAQFWWVVGLMLTLSGAMLWVFRRIGWL
jgi:magnesium transporter